MKKFRKYLLILTAPLILGASAITSCANKEEEETHEDTPTPVYVVDSFINENNELIVRYSDGTEKNKGKVEVNIPETPETPTKTGTVKLTYDSNQGSVSANKMSGEAGTLITLQINPKDGFLIKDVKLNGSPLPSPYIFELSEGENEVVVTFEAIPEVEPVDPEKEVFTVIFKNYDGSELYRTEVNEGQNAVYIGSTPVKPSDERNDYVFKGWDVDVSNVQSDLVTTAQYDATPRKYKVTFVDYDGTELDSQMLEYGTIPEYKGQTPTRPSTSTTTYVFYGWDKPLTEVKDNQVYTAVYVENYAPTFRSKGLVFEIQNENLCFAVKSYYGDDKNVIIPKEFQGRPVTMIKDGAFKGHKEIETVYLPETIESIGDGVFNGCENLNKIIVNSANQHFKVVDDFKLVQDDQILVYVIPTFNGILDLTKDNLEIIRYGALNGNNLKVLVVSGDVLSTVESAFGGKEEIKPTMHSIVIDGGNVKDYAFDGCKDVQSITILTNENNPTTIIGDYAFQDCAKVKTLVFDDYVTKIGEGCFKGMTALEDIRFGIVENNITDIGTDLFVGCTSLQGNYSDSCYYFGNYMYARLFLIKGKDTTNLHIEPETKYIDKAAFSGRKTIKTVTFDAGYDGLDRSLLTLDTNCFSGCTNLETFNNVPNTLEVIGENFIEGTAFLANNDTFSNMDGIILYVCSRAGISSNYISEHVLGINSVVFRDIAFDSYFTVSPYNKIYALENNCIINKKTDTLCRCLDRGSYDNNGEKISYSLTFYNKHIGNHALRGSEAKELYFPEAIDVGDYSCYGTAYLEIVKFGADFDKIGIMAFGLGSKNNTGVKAYIPKTCSQFVNTSYSYTFGTDYRYKLWVYTNFANNEEMKEQNYAFWYWADDVSITYNVNEW